MIKKPVSNRRVIVTGGPSAGKTTLLTALAERGYTCVHDSARAIIQDRVRRGLSCSARSAGVREGDPAHRHRTLSTRSD